MIDFDIAKTWHRIFAEKIEYIALGLVTELPAIEEVCNDSLCSLGAWLNAADITLQHCPAYPDLLQVHKHFHQCACDIVRSARGEQLSYSLAEVHNQMISASAQIMHLIDEIAAQGQAASYRSHFEAPSATKLTSWDPSLEIGEPTIDSHHRAIAAILDTLEAHRTDVLRSDIAVSSLGELGKIIDTHFLIEEALMRKLGMPADELEQHIRQHSEILDQYVEINFLAMRSPQMHLETIIPTIRRWVIDHVIEYDFAIKKYLADAPPPRCP